MLFVQRVAIQAPVLEQDETGQELITSYENVAGKDNLPARIVPVTDERRQERMTVITDRFDVLLGGYHPDLTPDMYVLDNEAVYNILRVVPAARLPRPVTQLVAERVAI